MALPPPDHPCWAKSASGGLASIDTNNLALQLMAKRQERSDEPPARKIAEIQAFFAKWERMLGWEIAQMLRD